MSNYNINAKCDLKRKKVSYETKVDHRTEVPIVRIAGKEKFKYNFIWCSTYILLFSV